MSSGTSADQDRFEDEIPPVAPRHKDGALICKRRMEDGGRCGKLVLTPDKELICANGHTVCLELLRDALLCDPRANVSDLALFQVQDEATWKAMLKRVTSKEFKPMEVHARENSFLFSPTVFPALLAHADRLDARAADDLRAMWEINLNNVCPVVWKWIAEAGSAQNRLLRREKAIAVWGHWDNPSLAGLLVKHTLLQQVAQDLRLPESEPFVDSINEILMAMADPKRTALVFSDQPEGKHVVFDLRLDPESRSQEFGVWSGQDSPQFHQILLRFDPNSMLLYMIPRTCRQAETWCRQYMAHTRPEPVESVKFQDIGTGFTCVLRDPPKARTQTPAYSLGYEVICAFVETYGLRRRPDWG